MTDRRIYKFQLSNDSGYQDVAMPDGPGFGDTEVLSIGLSPQGGLCVWADVIPHETAYRLRSVYLAVTGGSSPDVDAHFVGTVNDRGYVVHCWDCGWK